MKMYWSFKNSNCFGGPPSSKIHVICL